MADLFHQLVTPSGTKIAHSATDLADYVDLSEAEVTQLLEKLARPDTRIVRAVAPPRGDPGPTRYEIFHDVLAPSILDWRSRQASSRRARALVRRRIRRLLAVIGAAVVALIVWLAISALNARNQADLSATRAHSAETQAERAAGQLRVKSHQEAQLAARYSHQAVVERSLKRQADRNAGQARLLAVKARNQGAQATQLAAVNETQASHESVLAAAAQRSATAAELSLSIANEAAALSSVSPNLQLCTDPNGNPAFSVAKVDRTPAGATATFVSSGFRETVPTGGQTSTVAFSGVESNCNTGSPKNRPQFANGETITIFVVLKELAWLYEGQLVAKSMDVGKGRCSRQGTAIECVGPAERSLLAFEFRKQETCRTPGSRAPASQVPLQCPPLP